MLGQSVCRRSPLTSTAPCPLYTSSPFLPNVRDASGNHEGEDDSGLILRSGFPVGGAGDPGTEVSRTLCVLHLSFPSLFMSPSSPHPSPTASSVLLPLPRLSVVCLFTPVRRTESVPSLLSPCFVSPGLCLSLTRKVPGRARKCRTGGAEVGGGGATM